MEVEDLCEGRGERHSRGEMKIKYNQGGVNSTITQYHIDPRNGGVVNGYQWDPSIAIKCKDEM